MSAAVAAPNGAAISNAEMPIIPSEVRFIVFPSEGSSLPGGILAALAMAREIENDFRIAFPRIVATKTQHKVKDYGNSSA
jgi:hypothetical protein